MPYASSLTPYSLRLFYSSYLNELQIRQFNVKFTHKLYGFKIIVVTRNPVNLPEQAFSLNIVLNVKKFVRCRNRGKSREIFGCTGIDGAFVEAH
jgi:hypothetical protein